MHHPNALFTRFKTDVEQLTLPAAFTYPFFYQPHELCEIAARELQDYLLTRADWLLEFGVPSEADKDASEEANEEENTPGGMGKMFGVLLVRSPQGELGYFSAFSGKVSNQNLHPHFVPPVFDMLTEMSFFHREQQTITEISQEIKSLSGDPRINELKTQLSQFMAEYQSCEQRQRLKMIEGRAARKLQRQNAQAALAGEALQTALDALAVQSVAEKNELKYLKLEWDEKIAAIQAKLAALTTAIETLKAQRKVYSNTLQNKLFEQYQFANALGEHKSLRAIFAASANPAPPAGAGECAAPKLLQYAYLHGYTPLAMAEFWWGTSPKSEVRQHKKFYPSCHGKCHPILSYMLQGLEVDPNPLEQNWGEDKPLEVLYQDDAIVVVNKPSGLLSVPGKAVQDSAYTRVQALFPDVEGPFVLHRLDMATSGLLVFALTRRANKSLQQQFIGRGVEKRYIATVEGVITQGEGEINLPMRGDPDDRPRQLVCFEHGKPATTYWQLIAVKDGRSKLYMHPKTGRTHQLRVHCAHHMGLNMPMVGDGLYGEQDARLHLHAEQLAFDHPYTKERMTFSAKCEF